MSSDTNSVKELYSDTNSVEIAGVVQEANLTTLSGGTSKFEMTVRSKRVRSKKGKKTPIARLFPVVKYGAEARKLANEIKPGAKVFGFGYLDSQIRDAVGVNGKPLYDEHGNPGKSWQLVPVMTKVTVRKPAPKPDAQRDSGEAQETAATPVAEPVPAPVIEPPTVEAGEDDTPADAPLATAEAGAREAEPPATAVEEELTDERSEGVPSDEGEAAEAEAFASEEDDEVQVADAAGSESPTAGGDGSGEQVSTPAPAAGEGMSPQGGTPVPPTGTQGQMDVGTPQLDPAAGAAVRRNDHPTIHVTKTAMPLVVQLVEKEGVSFSEITASGNKGADGRVRMTQADAKEAAKKAGLNVTRFLQEAREAKGVEEQTS